MLRAHCLARSRVADAQAGLDAAAWSDWIDAPAFERRGQPQAGHYLADAARHTAAIARRYHAGRPYGVTLELDATAGTVRLAVGHA